MFFKKRKDQRGGSGSEFFGLAVRPVKKKRVITNLYIEIFVVIFLNFCLVIVTVNCEVLEFLKAGLPEPPFLAGAGAGAEFLLRLLLLLLLLLTGL